MSKETNRPADLPTDHSKAILRPILTLIWSVYDEGVAAARRSLLSELRPYLFHPESCDSQHELNDGWRIAPCSCGLEAKLQQIEGGE